MKTTLLCFVIIVFATFTCVAQTEKGSKLLGGSGSLRFNDGFGVSLNPNVGYFVANNLAVGSGTPLSYSKLDDYRYASLGILPFVRYYLGNSIATKVFADVNAGIIWFHTKGSYADDPERTDTYNQNYFGGGLGVVHFINEQVGLEVKPNYINGQILSNSRSGNLGVSFGLQIHMPKASKE